jgi:hypothetical protein
MSGLSYYHDLTSKTVVRFLADADWQKARQAYSSRNRCIGAEIAANHRENA